MFVGGFRARLVLSNHEAAALEALFEAHHQLLIGLDSRTQAGRKRLFASPGFDAALSIAEGEAPDRARQVRAHADRELPDRRLPLPLLDGNALISAGLKAGPQFKSLLDQAMDAQLEGRVTTAAEALALVQGFASRP